MSTIPLEKKIMFEIRDYFNNWIQCKDHNLESKKTTNPLLIRLFLEKLHPKTPLEVVIELKKLKIENL